MLLGCELQEQADKGQWWAHHAEGRRTVALGPLLAGIRSAHGGGDTEVTFEGPPVSFAAVQFQPMDVETSAVPAPCAADADANDAGGTKATSSLHELSLKAALTDKGSPHPALNCLHETHMPLPLALCDASP